MVVSPQAFDFCIGLGLTAIDDGKVRAMLLDERDHARHLWVVDEGDVDTTLSERTTLREPVPQSILLDPVVERLLFRVRETERLFRDALET